jgi:hypothetical protein
VRAEEEDKGKGIQNRVEQVKKKRQGKKREGEVEGRICRELRGSEQIKLNYIKSEGAESTKGAKIDTETK